MSFSVTQVGVPDNAVTSAKIKDHEVASDDLAVSTVQYAEVEISAIELKALVAAPKTLVAAQGANTIIEFISCELAYDKGSVTYTIGNASNLAVRYTDADGEAVSSIQKVTDFLDQGDDQVRLLLPLPLSGLESIVAVPNAPLVLTL
ncbi:unnamed protein product, partial [marine sediment metagenome]